VEHAARIAAPDTMTTIRRAPERAVLRKGWSGGQKDLGNGHSPGLFHRPRFISANRERKCCVSDACAGSRGSVERKCCQRGRNDAL